MMNPPSSSESLYIYISVGSLAGREKRDKREENSDERLPSEDPRDVVGRR